MDGRDEVATIDLPYIERNRSRHGRIRFYFRFEGRRVGRLPDDPDTEAFAAEYWRLRKLVEAGAAAPAEPDRATPGRALPNSFRWLSIEYLKSDPFAALDATTQAKRRQIIDSMLLEPVKKGGADIFADMPIPRMTADNIRVLRDRKAATPFAADERLKILRQMFDTTRIGKDGRPFRLVKENPARLVQPFRVKTEGHHTITDDEIALYIRHHGIRSKAVLALIILMYTGIRVSDLTSIGPQHRRGDDLRFVVFKGRNRKRTVLTIPIHPVLDMVLGWHAVDGLVYVQNDYKRPFTIKGLSQRVSKWFSQAGLRHCTAHTVRKGLATALSENEATDAMLDGLFGWSDGKTSKIYTARRQQAKLARQAVLRIDWGEIRNILPHPDEGMEVPAATPSEKIRKINV